MIITRECIENDRDLLIPKQHTTLPDCKEIAEFIHKNFAIKECDGVDCLICDPENGIALCELFYETIFSGHIFELCKREDYFGSEEGYRWSEEENKYGVEFEKSDVFVEMCDHERCANLMEMLIKRGYILKINKGDKFGPYLGSVYFENSYYVVPDYAHLLKNGICLDGDIEAAKLLKDFFASYYEDFQFPFTLYLERDSFPDMISVGLFDSIRTEFITDDLDGLISLPHTSTMRDNIVMLLDYLQQRGCKVDANTILGLYDNR